MMPSRRIDQQSMPYLTGDLHFSQQSPLGFCKFHALTNLYPIGTKTDPITGLPCRTPDASLPLDKLIQRDPLPTNCLLTPDQKLSYSCHKYAVGADRTPTRSLNLWTSMDLGSQTRSNTDAHLSWDNTDAISSQHETGLSSASFTEMFNQNLRLSSNNAFYSHSVDTAESHCEEEEPFESLKEIEAQAIGNLLPNDDDLLSGVVDGLENIAQPTREDEIDDLDLFDSVGGMDLGDDRPSAGLRASDFPENSVDRIGGTNVSANGDYPYGEQSSRTLFVRNINSNVEDSELQALFEQYGDIRTLYTACKHRGFVMISYYDIRAARSAMRALQNKPLRRRKLDIHYSIPKDHQSENDVNQGTLVVYNLDFSVSYDDLLQIFGAYGEIKQIRETPHKGNQKFIEFYDVRAANEALRALNRSEIVGKMIHIEPNLSGGARWSSMQPPLPILEPDQQGLHMQQSSAGYPNYFVSSSSIQSETGMGTNAEIRSTVGPFLEKRPCNGISSTVPSGLQSLLRADSAGNQQGLSEAGNSVSQIKHDSGGLPIAHPRSLPEYYDGFANGFPCNSGSNVHASISSLPQERIENTYLGRKSTRIGMGIGTSGNGSGPFSGPHYIWSNSNHSEPAAFMWRNSPSFSSGVCSPQHQSRIHGPPSSSSYMLNSTLPMNGHHVGSAPAVNPSLWDRRSLYPGGSPEASRFHHGPLGYMRNSGSHLQSMDFVSPNMFPRIGGNCMDLPISSSNVGLQSHQRGGVMYPSRGQINMISSFESPSERAKSRRSEISCTQTDIKKQFELDVDRIRRGEDNRTTLMIKNIPNKYTSKMLMAAIDEKHRGTYDFIYLPIDFKNKCNVGYAFLNMVDPSHIVPFYETFNSKKWEKFNSEKVASIAYARIQGKEALVAHFQNSSLMNEDKRCRPILLHSDGANAGDQVPFPMGVNIRSKSGRSRSSSNEDHDQGSPPNFANKEDSSNYGDSSSSSGKESD